MTYIGYMNTLVTYTCRLSDLVGTPPRHEQLSDSYKTTQVPTPHTQGPMSLVTKDPRVRYVYGLGWMSLVTNYIRILLSYLYSVWAGCHWSQPVNDQPVPLTPHPPFGVLKRGNVVMDPEKIVTIFWGYIKLVNYDLIINIHRTIKGTIRGDGVQYNTCWVSSPRILNTY